MPDDKFQEYLNNLFSTNKDFFEFVIKTKHWPTIEHLWGNIYFAVASYFAQADYTTPPTIYKGQEENKIPSILIPNMPRPEELTTQYVAVNFRGLYRRNGRETTLAPFKGLREKYPHFEVHKELHELYMTSLCRKSESINQLALSTTILTLNSISVFFDKDVESSIEYDSGHAQITVGSDITASYDDIARTWKEKTKRYLTNLNAPELGKDAKEKLNNEFRTLLVDTRKRAINAIQQKTVTLLKANFFSKWLEFIKNDLKENVIEAVKLFEQWLVALCWLSFYCHEDHAGQYFYSVKLPALIPMTGEYGAIFPFSSISIVTEKPLIDNVALWKGLELELKHNYHFSSLYEAAKIAFDDFRKKRIKIPARYNDTEKNLAKFVSKVDKDILAVDLQKLDFLLKVSRMLVGMKHEGIALHFCFIFGFSWERIDAESKGSLTAVISNLYEQWEAFEKYAINQSGKFHYPASWQDGLIHSNRTWTVSEETDYRPGLLSLYAQGMSQWIKTGDLPLQPWDTVLFFEDYGNKAFPVPTSIVRLNSLDDSSVEPINTEFKLRETLRNLTLRSHNSVGIIIDQTGLILFSHGKDILISCNSKEDFNDSFKKIGLWPSGDDLIVDRDQFSNYLVQLSASTNEERNIRKRLCDVVISLCEALVTLKHGAFIIFHLKPMNNPSQPPLNPVWLVEPEINGPALEDGILFYALMAALDGATEIHLSAANNTIVFSARRFAIPKEGAWAHNKPPVYGLLEQFHKSIDILGIVGQGTRHHNALCLSADLGASAIVLTVSADGPISLWHDGKRVQFPDKYEPRFKP
jgi:hypothetical protein